jgi:dipeptidase
VIKDPTSFLSNLGDAKDKFNEAKAKQEQMDELKAKTKEVRNAILDEFGIKIIKDEKEFKRLLQDRLNQELAGKDISLDKKVIDQLIETASFPNDSNTKKLIDTIAEYDVSGLGIGQALKAFNLDICPQ